MQLQDYLNNLRAIIHDTNSSDFNDATLTSFINQARYRVAMDTHCVRGFLSVTGGNALNTIGAQENYNFNGTIGGVNITSAGNNLYTNPSVTFTNAVGDTGSGAKAVAIASSGVLTNIFMTNWGSGYGAAPTVNITDPTGTGATANATLLANIFDVISVDVLWGDQRVQFEYQPFGMFQTLCRTLTTQEDVPSLFTLHKGIQQMFLFQVPDQAYVMEWDILTLPAALTQNSQVDTQIVAPWSDAVQFYAAHLCMASLGNYQMADFWYTGKKQQPGKYDSRCMQLAATGFSHRVYNPFRTYMKRWRRM
jgi:hypothetical protein